MKLLVGVLLLLGLIYNEYKINEATAGATVQPFKCASTTVFMDGYDKAILHCEAPRSYGGRTYCALFKGTVSCN